MLTIRRGRMSYSRQIRARGRAGWAEPLVAPLVPGGRMKANMRVAEQLEPEAVCGHGHRSACPRAGLDGVGRRPAPAVATAGRAAVRYYPAPVRWRTR